jgi:hypothetical protein
MSKLRDFLSSLDQRLPTWVTPPVIGILILVAVFTITILITEIVFQPGSNHTNTSLLIGTATAVSKSAPTQKVLPREWLENRDQTISIVIAGTFLVMIIVGGTLGAITRRSQP